MANDLMSLRALCENCEQTHTAVYCVLCTVLNQKLPCQKHTNTTNFTLLPELGRSIQTTYALEVL